MLPRMDTFKEIIFTPRIIAFNQSFVPLGTRSKQYPFAVVWHEAISGRSKEDIVSAFYAFLLANRDTTNITIWLDNCSSQNKNWTLIYFLIFIVNSSVIAAESVILKYFQSGHTFMAADSFHHQVEMSLIRMKKVYDFNDFIQAVSNANSSKVNVHSMKIGDFFKFTDYISKHKLKNMNPRVYLKDIVSLKFERGKKILSYKTNFESAYTDFINLF
ncbi:uncharacterized protein LOC126886301 [Diabrotica virgifera virgifera]|uniref:DUF7869 domain-containing protein n=1 Tax=Diabrotica virgifera virgifera TaxID=50390 RepID=A0ABM5KG04_DIAVI|nr:uncharacterized protein LOC126886301 [Diabrotica virgifera virgifera]